MSESYTVRYAHLRFPAMHEVGSKLVRGDVIGIMGSTGQSTGPHLHIDVVHGVMRGAYRLHEIVAGNPEPDFNQLRLFIDSELGGPYRITTYVYDYRYVIAGQWKAHPGYDIVFDTPLKEIHWNRSMPGTVIRNAFDSGYGNHLHITFEA